MQKYCFTLDLVDEPQLIAGYKRYHQNVWPEIKKSITDAGITNLEIYLPGNRLFMLMETAAIFRFEKKAEMDAINPKVQEWENLMWKYQQALPQAKPGEKWLLMDKIFQL